MRAHHILALVGFPLLVGCAEDDPTNVPLRGQWEIVRTLDSVTIDGIAFTPDDLPAEFREFEGTQNLCGEPYYNDRNWQAADVSGRTAGLCELESYEVGSRRATLGGRCSLARDDVTYTPVMQGNSRFAESEHRDVITMEGTITVPGDPAPHVLKIIAVQEGTRIGDC